MATTRRRTTKAASAKAAPVTNRRTSGTSTRRTTKAAPAKAQSTRKAPAENSGRDVTGYAEKPATDYQKAFASWIVREVGYDPDSAPSKKAAFLRGVAIATAARPAFMDSNFLEEWRERNGVAKRGPKPAEEKAASRSTRRGKAAPEPEEIDEDEEFEDEDELEDEEDSEFDDEDEEDSEDFDEEDDEDFDEEDDEELEDEEEEEEEAPAPRRRGRPAKSTTAPAKAAPSKATGRKAAAKSDDDDFIF